MEDLKSKWEFATVSLCDADTSIKWWTLIEEKFSSEDRSYHNHGYLLSLFKLFDVYKEKMTCPQAVALAVFFHKLEYDPRSGDGEEKSLEQLNKFLAECGDANDEGSIANATRELLGACASNFTPAHTSCEESGSEDQHYLLDMIMAVLGADTTLYEEYKIKVQAEYSHLTPQAYRKLRLKILQSLLMIPNLYATKEFQDLYEKPARNNVSADIVALKELND